MNEVYVQLKELLETIESYEQALMDELEYAQKYSEAQVYVPNRLSEFDKGNKELFIFSRAGEEPRFNSAGIFNSRKRKEEYEEARYEYALNKEAAEMEYLQVYREKRAELDRLDKEDKATRLQRAEEGLKSANEKVEQLNALFKEKQIVSDRLCKKEILKKMMTYFEDNRVDTLREAINLYYAEDLQERQNALLEANLKGMRELLNAHDISIGVAVERSERAFTLAHEALDEAERARNLVERVINR